MKKSIIGLATILFSFLFPSAHALALGLGGYIEASGGNARTPQAEQIGGTEDKNVDAGAFSAGFTLDTAVRGPQLFNYRLHVGFEALAMGDDSDRYSVLGGGVIDNTFGIALLRTEKVRLWAGPTFRIGYYSGHFYNEDNWNNDHKNDDDYWNDEEVGSLHAYALGIGFAVGANFNVSRSFSICPTIGYRYTRHFGSWDTDNDYGSNDGDLSGWTSTVFAGVDFLFDLR